ncbi:MAG: transcriptional repressor [Firmicutes bacterium]|nr:transcriptional repressor [Bacillota bacterium]
MTEKNIAVTSEIRLVLEVLNRCRGHQVNDEKIHEILKYKRNKEHRLNSQRVKEVLELLVKIGLVEKTTDVLGISEYEIKLPTGYCNHKLVCLRCGRVKEVGGDVLKKLKKDIELSAKFYMLEKPIKIYGYCEKCRGLSNNSSLPDAW